MTTTDTPAPASVPSDATVTVGHYSVESTDGTDGKRWIGLFQYDPGSDDEVMIAFGDPAEAELIGHALIAHAAAARKRGGE